MIEVFPPYRAHSQMHSVQFNVAKDICSINLYYTVLSEQLLPNVFEFEVSVKMAHQFWKQGRFIGQAQYIKCLL